MCWSSGKLLDEAWHKYIGIIYTIKWGVYPEVRSRSNGTAGFNQVSRNRRSVRAMAKMVRQQNWQSAKTGTIASNSMRSIEVSIAVVVLWKLQQPTWSRCSEPISCARVEQTRQYFWFFFCGPPFESRISRGRSWPGCQRFGSNWSGLVFRL